MCPAFIILLLQQRLDDSVATTTEIRALLSTLNNLRMEATVDNANHRDQARYLAAAFSFESGTSISKNFCLCSNMPGPLVCNLGLLNLF